MILALLIGTEGWERPAASAPLVAIVVGLPLAFWWSQRRPSLFVADDCVIWCRGGSQLFEQRVSVADVAGGVSSLDSTRLAGHDGKVLLRIDGRDLAPDDARDLAEVLSVPYRGISEGSPA